MKERRHNLLFSQYISVKLYLQLYRIYKILLSSLVDHSIHFKIRILKNIWTYRSKQQTTDIVKAETRTKVETIITPYKDLLHSSHHHHHHLQQRQPPQTSTLCNRSIISSKSLARNTKSQIRKN